MSEIEELTEIDQKILDGYLDDLVNGELTTTTSIKETEQGIIKSKVMKRATCAKDRLEYLRMRFPEKWKIPQPLPVLTINQNTLAMGMEDLRQLLITNPKPEP